jgi:uncharacterized protein YbjT (DUF2867 family)
MGAMSEQSIHRPVLVTGATGPHGGAVARALLRAGRRVRVLTRNPTGGRARELAELGAELATGDLVDRDSLVRAMDDVAAAYAVTTPFGDGPAAEVEQGRQLIDASRVAGVPWLLLASVASADKGTGVPHFESKRQIEQQLHASQVPHTVIAPTYFYENIGDPAQATAGGELALALAPDRPLQQIALADLSEVVVSVLSRRAQFLGERIELAGDQPTPQQMADAVSAALGKPIRYRQLPLEEVAARSADLAAMYCFLGGGGYQVDIAGVRARFAEVSWSTFGAWVTAELARP